MEDWGERGDLFDALIIGAADGAAAESVRLAEGRVVRQIDWRDVTSDARPLRSAVLLIEAEGVGCADLEKGLSAIATLAASDDLQVVAAFDLSQIDAIADVLLSPGAQLLVTPTMFERVAALTVAQQAAQRAICSDRVAEGEAARLAKLNAEVARIAEVLARLSQRDEPGLARGDVADRRLGFDSGPPATDTPIDPAIIRNVIRARRLRDKQFGAGLFEDPAWDMMLDLFAAHLEHAEVSVSSLCIAAAVAPTTALRWIGKMTDAGLFVREADPFDRRRAFMALSPQALAGMRAYVATCRAQGLPIV